jgi:hypothetical protein
MRKFKDKGRIEGLFVPMLHETLDAPAWRAMSHGARLLYLALKRRYTFDGKNNGRVHLSSREARQELSSGLEEIGNWFRELQFYGFIVMTRRGCLGVEGKGKAPHWRLTELGYMNERPTKDYLKWSGEKFQRRIPARKKQKPDPESRITPIRKAGSPLIQKAGSPEGESDPESRIMSGHRPDPESRIISMFTTPHSKTGGRERQREAV